MKSGMLAAESIFATLQQEKPSTEVVSYRAAFDASWLHEELYKVRNIRPSFRWGLWGGLLYSAIDTYVFGGRAPWTMHHHDDHTRLRAANECPRIEYPKPDGTITFDKLSSVFVSNTNHEENQPSHLRLKDNSVPIRVNLARYDAPETRYCPAGVYEITGRDTANPSLQINAQNCLHCKTCDIKDPQQNINWTVPEGGGGPNYPNM